MVRTRRRKSIVLRGDSGNVRVRIRITLVVVRVLEQVFKVLHVRLTMFASREGRGVVQPQVPLLEELEDRVKKRRVTGGFRRLEELPRRHLIRHSDRPNVSERRKHK